ncbi:MAG: hypothetical protein ACOY93_18735 [Bacillota bacterium]
MAHYRGATARELQEAGGLNRLVASIRPGGLMPHEGEIRLEGDALVLEGWLRLTREEVAGVSIGFDESYTRWHADGLGPNGPLPGIFGSGEPLVLQLRDGTRCYLTIDRQPLTGLTKNRLWLERVQEWLQGR